LKGIFYSHLAFSVSIGLINHSYALTPINSSQDGRIIQGGTYYNTANAKTTFVNSGSGGLWLKSGTTVRGLEVNSGGSLTNHGGTVQLYAPGNVVRVDGNIDVRGMVNGQGAYLGDGGKVYVDAGYLYQSGKIFASGKNGGLVQVNVGAATLANGSQIEAKGLNGAGGVVNFASSGPVDLQQGSNINSSGLTVGAFDRNVINIEGGMVNAEGVLRADGIATACQGARGGTIRLTATGQSTLNEPQDLPGIKDILNSATFRNSGDTSPPTLTLAERDALIARNRELGINDESILIGRVDNIKSMNLVSANGAGSIPSSANDPYGGPTRAGDGGTIIMSSRRDIHLNGLIQANGANGGNRVNPYAGGNGGTIIMGTQSVFSPIGFDNITTANGGSGGSSLSATGTGAKGGDGGIIAISTNDVLQVSDRLESSGGIGGNGYTPGHGGQGGMIMFSGGQTTEVNGLLVTRGALGGNNSATAGGLPGTIAVSGFVNPDFVKQQGFINGQFVSNSQAQKPQPRELLTHGENLISMINAGTDIITENFFKDTLPQSHIRSVTDPNGTLGTARQEVINKNTSTSSYVYRNLVVNGNGELGASIDDAGKVNLNLQPPTSYGQVSIPTALSRGRGFDTLNTLTVRSNGNISTVGLSTQPTNFWIMGREHNIFGGGHISMMTYTGSSLSIDDTLQTKGTANSGSIMLSARNELNVGKSIPTQLITSGGLHGGVIQLSSIGNMLIKGGKQETKLSADGQLMGGGINVMSDGSYTSQSKTTLSADVVSKDIFPPGNPQGGIISVLARSNLTNGQNAGADGNISNIHASAYYGRGGFVKLASDSTLINDSGVIEANGGLHGGVVSLTGRIASAISGLPQLQVSSLTPPKTTITGSPGTDFVGRGSVINFGTINALGNGGRIYLGGDGGVLFAEKPNSIYPNVPSLNVQPVLPSLIFTSSNPNITLQALGQSINRNGQQVYIVAGNELTSKAGQTRSAADIVNAEAAANHSAPNVNPNQDGQGAAFTQDFLVTPNP